MQKGGRVKSLLRSLLLAIPPVKEYYRFRQTITNRHTVWQWLRWKLKRNKRIYWPVHPMSDVTAEDNIYVGVNTNAGTRPGCYIQGIGGVYIGNYVNFAHNIGIISANHDENDQTKHVKKAVHIGDYTWIGQGAVILPGVTLGPRTIVGANAVVTKSFPDGFCVIAGNPAKLIKTLDSKLYKPTKFKEEFYGYVPKEKWAKFKAKYKIKTPQDEDI